MNTQERTRGPITSVKNVTMEKIEKMNLSDGISNEVVLTMVNESRCLTETLRKRKKNWI